MKRGLILFVLIILNYKGFGQSCSLTVTITSSNTVICSGNPVILTALATNGTPGYSYSWSTGEKTSSIIVNKPETYTVSVTDNTPGCLRVIKQVTIMSAQIPEAPTAAGASVCPNETAIITATAPGGSYKWYNAAVGGKLLAESESYRTPPLSGSTTYFVETVFAGCTSLRTPVTVLVTPNPVANGISICSGTATTLNATGGDSFQWYDSATGGNLLNNKVGFITPILQSTTTYYVQSRVKGCTSGRTPVTVTVNPIPQSPSVAGITICSGTGATLTATSPGGIYQWYSVASGGVPLVISPDYTTPALTSNTTYYVQTTLNGCTSDRTPVTVRINPIPKAPLASGISICSGTSATLTASGPAGAFQWFGSASSETVLAAGQSFITPVLNSSFTYYVQSTISGCTSARTPVTVTVNTRPAAPSVSGIIICPGTSATLTANSLAGNYQWFDAASGGNLIGSDSVYVSPVLTDSVTYYVQTTLAGCTSLRTAVGISILSGPVAPAISDIRICSGTNATLLANSTVGTYSWYDAASGGNLLGTEAFYTTPILSANTIYYVQTAFNGCKSARIPVKVTVYNCPGSPPPADPPTALGTSICAGNTAALTATAPGGNYNWFDKASGGISLSSSGIYITPPLLLTTTYFVQTTIEGITSSRTAVTVTVNSTPPPEAMGTTICIGNIATLSATGPEGDYRWYDESVGGNLLSTSAEYTTPALTSSTTYYVQVMVNDCISARTPVTVTVNRIPKVTSALNGVICNGLAQNYLITSDLAGTTFSWSRAAVPNISNAEIVNQSSALISENLINTGSSAAEVTYKITPTLDGCTGPLFNYIVTVNPIPVVGGASGYSICNGTAPDYTIALNRPGASFNWSRAAVAGISNAAISGQTSGVIREILTNTGSSPIDVIYQVNSADADCKSGLSNLIVSVNPTVYITSAATTVLCSEAAQNYFIKCSNPLASFSWSRAAVANISNAAVTAQVSEIINETLINTGSYRVYVWYIITPILNGCSAPPFYYLVTVLPKPVTPIANSNTPVCIGSTIRLSTTTLPGAIYSWTGPDGFSSGLQNPVINLVSAKNAGEYSLIVTLGNCTSNAGIATVKVNEPPIANAGNNLMECINTQGIGLAGKITGGTTTGMWSSNGTGTFSPSNTQLNAIYIPSAADKSAGFVLLTLTSTSSDDCTPSSSSISIVFQALPIVEAGDDQDLCSLNPNVNLNGQVTFAVGGIWATTGSGRFIPSSTQLDAVYVASNLDIAKGTVALTLSSTGNGICNIVTDELTLKFIPPPVINAGADRFVIQGKTVVLNPVVSHPDVEYLWMPNINIGNNKVKNPIVTAGDEDQLYTLTVTDSRGCISNEDQILIKVLIPPLIPNLFTPNGDGFNDEWNLKNLQKYPGVKVFVYTRYGEKVYFSEEYNLSWDGSYHGHILPVGTYYYIINTNFEGTVFSGSVTILK